MIKLTRTRLPHTRAEMKQHLQFTIDTNVQVYFCDPDGPWQQALAENTNGLLRQYFPKNQSVTGYR